MSRLSWLHISDLHWRASEAYEENRVAQALLLDLKTRKKIAPELDKIDFVFVTGDVAFSGKMEEYDLALQFFRDLSREFQITEDRMFVVPGNHDVDRAATSNTARSLIEALTSQKAVERLLTSEQDTREVLRRFQGFRHFGEKLQPAYPCLETESCFYVCNRDVEGRTLSVIGLNSAWASLSDNEQHRLLLGRRQVEDALAKAQGSDIKIILMHHPLHWLRDFDRDECEALLLRDSDFLLHGHLHRTDMRQLLTPGGGTIIIGAGACYEGPSFPNRYNLVHLDTTSGKGKLYFRVYSDQSGGFWVKDLLTYPNVDGEFAFHMRPHWHGHRSTPAWDITPPKETMTEPEASSNRQVPTGSTYGIDFGIDGLCGTVGEGFLTPLEVVKIGRALGAYVRERWQPPTVVIMARDTRNSGQGLMECLSDGLRKQGTDVIDLGIATTAALMFVARWQGAALAVMLSGPAKQPQLNCIRLLGENGLVLPRGEQDEILGLLDQIGADTLENSNETGDKIDGQHFVEFYIDECAKSHAVEGLPGLRVVLDCANGSGSQLIPKVFRRSKVEFVPIHCAPDGTGVSRKCGFDYTRRNPSSLAEVVIREKAAYGLAFDKDADRLVLVNSEGVLYEDEVILLVLAAYEKSEIVKRGSRIVTTRQLDERLEEAAHQHGISLWIPKDQGRAVQEEVWDQDCFLGCEVGGTFVINRGDYVVADAVWAALALIRALCSPSYSFAQLIPPLKSPGPPSNHGAWLPRSRWQRMLTILKDVARRAFLAVLLVLALAVVPVVFGPTARNVLTSGFFSLVSLLRRTIDFVSSLLDWVEGLIVLAAVVGATIFVLIQMFRSARLEGRSNLRALLHQVCKFLRRFFPGGGL